MYLYLFQVSPSIFAAIPRFWNKLHSSFQNELKIAIENEKDTEKHKEIKNELLEKYGKSLGNRIRNIVTGGAPTADDVFSFLRMCFSHASVANGYGATEVGG